MIHHCKSSSGRNTSKGEKPKDILCLNSSSLFCIVVIFFFFLFFPSSFSPPLSSTQFPSDLLMVFNHQPDSETHLSNLVWSMLSLSGPVDLIPCAVREAFFFSCSLVLVLFVTLSKQPWALFSPLPGHLLEASGNQVQAPTSRAFMLKFAATLPPTLAFVILPRCTSLCTRYEKDLNSTIRLLKLWWDWVTLSPLNIDMYQPFPIFLC